MSLFPAFLATRFPLKDFSWLAHFDPIGYPVLLLRCNEKRFIFFFFPLPFVQSSPSSQFSRRIIASSIRSYTRFHIKSLISYIIFSKINKNIGDKKRKEKKERNFSRKFYRTERTFLDNNGWKKKEKKKNWKIQKIQSFPRVDKYSQEGKEGEFFNANSEYYPIFCGRGFEMQTHVFRACT